MLKALSIRFFLLGAVIVPGAQAGELTKFSLRTCSPDGSRCVLVESAKVAESSIGQIWVSGDASVKVSGAGDEMKWTSARVVIDLKREQLVIEELKSSKLIETVISLKTFTVKRNEIVL